MDIIKASLMMAVGSDGGGSALQHNPTFTTNGEKHPEQGYDGFDYVTVDVPASSLSSLYADKNDVYYASDYDLDGWHTVSVDVSYVAEDPSGLTVTIDTPVNDVATHYYIKCVCIPESPGSNRLKYEAQLYDDDGDIVERYGSVSFPESQRADWKWKGIEIDPATGAWTTLVKYTGGPTVSYIQTTGTSNYLRDYYSGQQGYSVKN